MAPIRLTFACEDGLFKRPLIEGRVRPEGIEFQLTLRPSSEIFLRQLGGGEFDVSELSLSSYLLITTQGDRRFVGLPVFPSRRFFHTNCLVRADRGIERPQDLRGKRIGIPEYQVTSMVWTRGALQHEFGVPPAEIDWWVERTPERSHAGATGFRVPAGVRIHAIPPETSIGAMVASGALDATFSYISQPNAVDRSGVDLRRHRSVRPLFPDSVEEGVRYFARTGIHPVNHLIVVRRPILERHPWVALNLYQAFAAARERVLTEAAELTRVYFGLGLLPGGARQLPDEGVYPYGVRANLRMLEVAAQYAREQGVIPRAVDPAQLFAASTLGL
jgi:4,5-dihydroxyphthalate decarboxylase